ncbi:hypothetical protein [Microcoleus sp. Pol10D4]|uniref:hypothetical protein n=1 Tax=Microcoleus sp. Pol10D4 TaxID=3055387 RepID=UPI002FD681A5
MLLSQIKDKIESNLSQKVNPLEGISIDSPAILEFLDGLMGDTGINLGNVHISQPDKDSLQVAMTKPLVYPIAGGGAGSLELAKILLTLNQGEEENFGATLDLEGTFKLTADRSLTVQGSLSDPNSGTLLLTVTSQQMPQLTELAAQIGIGSLTDSLKSVGLSLPVLDQIELGFQLFDQKVTQITTKGSMTLGTGELDMTCNLLPEVIIKGGIKAGSQLTVADLLVALPLDPSELPSSQLQTLQLETHPKAKTYSAAFTLANDWEIDLGGTTLALTSIKGQINSTGELVTAQLNSTINIDGTQLLLTSDYGSDRAIVFSGEITPGQRISLTSVVDKLMGSLVDLPSEVPNLDLTDFNLSLTPKTGEFTVNAAAMDSWEIPVGIDGLQLDDISLILNRTLTENGKKAIKGIMGCELQVAGTSFRSDYSFPGEFVLKAQVPALKLSSIVQELCGSSLLRDMPLPASVQDVDFKNVAITIAPKSKFFSLKADSPLGIVELLVKKIASDWGFIVGFLPPTSWKFSTIADELKVLDGLKFSDTAMVLSSADDRALVLTSLAEAGSDLTVSRGLNFIANLDMRGIGVDALLGIERLRVYTAIGGSPSDILLEAQIDGEFKLSDGVAFGDIKFRLQPAPTNFSLTLLGTVTAILNKSTLAFVGGMQVQPRSALLQASMLGIWNEPFDTKGVTIANIALDLGVSFPPPLPTIGIAGTLQVGSFQGAVAVKFDSAMPSRSMLAIAFNRLYLMDVISTFCGASVARAIPSSLANTVLNIGFENVNIYIVPQPTSIGELTFDQGFYLGGTLNLWGLRATASLSIDYLEGTELKAEVEPIDMGGVFKLKGSGGKPNPSLYFKLSPNPMVSPTIDISGVVELLGLVSETQVQFSDNGFYFFSSGKIFNLFEATLEVKGEDFKSGGSMSVKASMKNDLLSYLREKATAAIKSAADSATRELTEAQNDVRKAQDEVNKLNNTIAETRQTIEGERERDIRRLRDAQAAVSKAQDEVNKLNRDIDNMKKTIEGERERDTSRLRDAQAALSQAQSQVNKLQQEIDSTKSKIAQLKSDIDNKKRWFDQSRWYEKSYRWAEFSAYATAKGSEIGALYTKIGGIEAAKATANGVLEVAKQTVRGLEAGAQSFPIDADPRMLGLYTARGTANGVLEAAKLTLRGMEQAAKNVPIDADPRILGLFTARETAQGALNLAILTLEGIKKSVGAMADVGQFIADVGLGGLLDVKSAQFEGTLEATQGGSVLMAIEVVFMKGQSQHLALSFNFMSPQQAALELAKKLLPA